jgi:hypothetical protein
MLVYFIGGTLGTAFRRGRRRVVRLARDHRYRPGAIALAMIITAAARPNTESLG